MSDSSTATGFKYIKCVTVGDRGVGKTSLLISYTTNKFPEDYFPTVFDDVGGTNVFVGGEPCNIQLFDAGDPVEYAKGLRFSYPLEIDVFLICFSVVSPTSFDNVRVKWVPELTNCWPRVPFLVVGTQSDLRDDTATLERLAKSKHKPISISNAEKLAKEVKAVKYVECSALTKSGLKNVFDEAIYTGCHTAKYNNREKER